MSKIFLAIGFNGPPAYWHWKDRILIARRSLSGPKRKYMGRDERFAKITAELVRLKLDVIVTSGTLSVMALRQATSVIPIVFAQAGDPVANNLVASLARPGGNVTGFTFFERSMFGKSLELTKRLHLQSRASASSLIPICPVCTENPIRIDRVTESPKRQRR